MEDKEVEESTGMPSPTRQNRTANQNRMQRAKTGGQNHENAEPVCSRTVLVTSRVTVTRLLETFPSSGSHRLAFEEVDWGAAN
jgi:hypothetical protein